MNNFLSTVIDICVLVFATTGLVTSIGILCFILYHRRQYPIDTSMVLICNNVLSMVVICLVLLDMYGHNLHGDLHVNVTFDNWWCYGRAYLLHVAINLLYYSYVLQAVFRFFRIILYKYKQLQTFQFAFLLILSQWLLSFLLTVPFSLLHYFKYVSEYSYCEILLSNNQAMLLMAMVGYQVPMTIIVTIYFYIVCHIKKIKNHLNLRNRQQANQRDVTVLRRILILLSFLVILAFPTTVLWMHYLVTGNVHPFAYHMGWSSFTLSVSILPTLTIFLTPQLRELFKNIWRTHRQIHPTIITRPALEMKQTATVHLVT